MISRRNRGASRAIPTHAGDTIYPVGSEVCCAAGNGDWPIGSPAAGPAALRLERASWIKRTNPSKSCTSDDRVFLFKKFFRLPVRSGEFANQLRFDRLARAASDGWQVRHRSLPDCIARQPTRAGELNRDRRALIARRLRLTPILGLTYVRQTVRQWDAGLLLSPRFEGT
jgi:hypothetical protein